MSSRRFISCKRFDDGETGRLMSHALYSRERFGKVVRHFPPACLKHTWANVQLGFVRCLPRFDFIQFGNRSGWVNSPGVHRPKGLLALFTPPAHVEAVTAAFASLFTRPSWRRAQALLCGTLLAPANHALASALRALGLAADTHLQKHRRRGARRPGRRLAQPGSRGAGRRGGSAGGASAGACAQGGRRPGSAGWTAAAQESSRVRPAGVVRGPNGGAWARPPGHVKGELAPGAKPWPTCARTNRRAAARQAAFVGSPPSPPGANP